MYTVSQQDNVIGGAETLKTLYLEDIRSDFAGFNRLASMQNEAESLYFENVIIDFYRCSFFEANMASPLYAVISGLIDRINSVTIQNMSSKVATILRKNQFLEMFNQTSIPDSNQTVFPFKIFKLTADAQFNDYLDFYLQGRGIPRMGELLEKHFKQSLFEIFQNAQVHSKSEPGIFVCGQFFPKKERVDISITDAGVGIAQNVKGLFPGTNVSSIGAINWALQTGNTTKRSGVPGGLGLDIIKAFILANAGKLQIISYDGYYEFSQGIDNFRTLKTDFPGTCINLEIKTNDFLFYHLNNHGDVSTHNIYGGE